jgi:hypothetical protein
MKLVRSIIICTLFLLPGTGLFAGVSVTGGVDASVSWRERKSEHFNVVFPDGMDELAGFIARKAEDVYGRMSEWAAYESKSPIDIVLTDNSDMANGFVKTGSRGLYITIYAVLPYQDLLDGSDASADWYETLLIHELAHVVHFDAEEGFPRLVNGLFGRLWYPNASTPIFYREGFAVYAETLLGQGYGRANYAYTDMYVRAAAEGQNPPMLDRVSSDCGVWPAGSGPYLYGASFVGYLARRYGEEKLFQYNADTSTRILCRGDLAFRKVYGKPLEEAWREWVVYEKEESARRGGGATAPVRVSGEAGRVYSLAVRDAKDLTAYSIMPTDSLGGLYLYDFTAGSERCVKRGLYAEDLAFSSDGRTLYYIRGDIEKNVYYMNNLYALDLDTGRERRITDTGHVQGFCLMPDGGFLLILSEFTGTAIGLVDKDGGNKQTGAGMPFPLVEQPAVSPDGRLVAFSCKDSSGVRSIYTCSTEDLTKDGAAFKRVTGEKMQAYSPHWLNNTEVLYTGSGDGVYNVYLADLLNHTVSRMTDVSHGVFDPAGGPDGSIIVKEYTSKGFCVSRLAPGEMGTSSLAPAEEAVFALVLDQYTKGTEGSASGGDTFNGPAVRYDPGRHLVPGYWAPFYFDERIDLGVGFFTSAEDLIGRHSYKTGVLYDIFDARVKGFFDYTLRSYPFNYFLSVFASQEAESDVFSPRGALYGGLSYPLLKRDFLIKADLGVVLETPYAGIDLAFLYSSAKSPGHWIGPEQGIVFAQDLFLNLTDDGFVFLSDRFSWYARIFDPFLLTMRAASKWSPGETERVIAGPYSEHIFAPLDGVYTLGYTDVVPVRFAMDLKTSLGFTLLQVDRGPGAFPLFFERAVASFFMDNGIAFSQHSTGYPAATFQELIDDPGSHIRTSIGPQLDLDFIICYDYPFTLQVGWAFPLSPGGTGGLFLDARFELAL